jgi:triosephosphate isomerase
MNKLVVGNWKMNPQSLKEAVAILKGISIVTKNAKKALIVICLPFPFLFAIKSIKTKKIKLGAQDVSEEEDGAHTGQVSASMLASIGVSYVIIGHSECRLNGDTNAIVNKKLLQVLKSKLISILCIGESTRDTHGVYLAFIKQQLQESLKSIKKAQMKNIVIAYEPVWAIGSSAPRAATPEEFTEIKIFIRKTLSDIYDLKTAHMTQIIYGASVHRENVSVFMEAGADGLLVGRDSINPKKFSAILCALN